MKRKIIFAIVEFITIVVGTGLFISSSLFEYGDWDAGYGDWDAGFGASMIVFGLLFRYWWKDSFFTDSLKESKEKEEETKTIKKDKKFLISFFLIFVFFFIGHHNVSIKVIKDNVSSIESDLRDIKSDVSSIEDKYF